MLQYASITGFIRTILTILLVYYGIKVVLRLFAPYLMHYVAKKVGRKFGQQFNQHKKQQQTTQKEGETSINASPKQNKTSNKNVGEYVDYEEID